MPPGGRRAATRRPSNGERRRGRPSPPQRAPRSAGSGFFISPDGYIVTNNHVIENAEEIKVVMKGGKEFKARVIGHDEGTDLAVIKIEGPDYLRR